MKIKFHYTYIIISLGFILSGYFSNLIVFTSIIIIHELGHSIIAKINNLDVQEITIYPFGGLTKINAPLNTNTNVEIKVAMAGITFQTIYYFIILFLYKNNLIREYIFNEFTIYNKNIFFLNLLPIHPLDGSIILTSLLSKFIPYKLSLKLNTIISVIVLIIILKLHIYKFNYTLILIFFVILKNLIEYHNLIEYKFNKFLLERYLYPKIYFKTAKITKVTNMYKEKYNLFKKKNSYIGEKQVLKEKFTSKTSKIFD